MMLAPRGKLEVIKVQGQTFAPLGKTHAKNECGLVVALWATLPLIFPCTHTRIQVNLRNFRVFYILFSSFSILRTFLNTFCIE
jgi:hypothetical protein